MVGHSLRTLAKYSTHRPACTSSSTSTELLDPKQPPKRSPVTVSRSAPRSRTLLELTFHRRAAVDEAGFFTTENFQRAVDCLSNWTTEVHTNDIFSTGARRLLLGGACHSLIPLWQAVVMIQVVNEPLQDTSASKTRPRASQGAAS